MSDYPTPAEWLRKQRWQMLQDHIHSLEYGIKRAKTSAERVELMKELMAAHKSWDSVGGASTLPKLRRSQFPHTAPFSPYPTPQRPKGTRGGR